MYNIERAFKTAKSRKWTQLYWAIDLHDTICPADYKTAHTDFYPWAKRTLHLLSNRLDCVLILFTSSHQQQIKETLHWLQHDNGIFFSYVNENPIIQNIVTADFSRKFYFNIMLDDKAGFNPKDWKAIYQLIKKTPILELQ
ncbi:MAG: hypothetical protein NTZ48_05635 [Candidatus Omnitrophica bacterium]|nr:hypothetical protein [Candidatus Omnitrophota bacterium]